LDIARIRSDILHKRKVKEVKEVQKQVRHLHIAPPILNQEISNSEEGESSCEEDLNVSDWEDVDNNSNNSDDEDYSDEVAENHFYWSEICTNWINLVERENQFDNEEDNHLLEMEHNFHAAGRSIHPADDETAKWKLEYLFKENMKAPTFLGIEFNSKHQFK
jgi:hypothetical protein